jgi:hypothetical protein
MCNLFVSVCKTLQSQDCRSTDWAVTNALIPAKSAINLATEGLATILHYGHYRAVLAFVDRKKFEVCGPSKNEGCSPQGEAMLCLTE